MINFTSRFIPFYYTAYDQIDYTHLLI